MSQRIKATNAARMADPRNAPKDATSSVENPSASTKTTLTGPKVVVVVVVVVVVILAVAGIEVAGKGVPVDDDVKTSSYWDRRSSS